MAASPAGWVLLAHIVRPQGRRGEVLAEIFTDFPQSFAERKRIFLRPPSAGHSDDVRPTNVESHWLHKGRIVLKFSEVNSISDAENLRGFDVVVPREERLPLEGDAVYVSDLLGLKVVDVNKGGSQDVGEITDVEPEGAGPAMLVIRTPGGEERLIPFIRAYLKKVDIDAGCIEMDLPAGLLAMQDPTVDEE